MASTADLAAQKIFNVSDRVALVTGGATGIGLMIAQGLAANGAKVYIGGRRTEKLQQAVQQHNYEGGGGKLIPIELDVTNKDSIASAVKVINDQCGRLDVLVNSAGQNGPESAEIIKDNKLSALKLGESLFDDQEFGEWGQLLTMNVASVYFVTVAFLGLLRKGTESVKGHSACVINIGSVGGYLKDPSMGTLAYACSKAAVHHLTQVLAAMFAQKGLSIRVNAIAPGLFPSEMSTRDASNNQGKSQLQQNELTNSFPARRPGRDEEMAGTALYLASPTGYFTNGQVFVVDGGISVVFPASI